MLSRLRKNRPDVLFFKETVPLVYSLADCCQIELRVIHSADRPHLPGIVCTWRSVVSGVYTLKQYIRDIIIPHYHSQRPNMGTVEKLLNMLKLQVRKERVTTTPVFFLSKANVDKASSVDNDNDDDDKNSVNLRDVYRPIFRMMAVFGVYHTPKSWRKQDGSDGTGDSYTTILQRFYCRLIQLFLFLNSIRSTIGLWYVEQRLLAMQIVVSLWLFHCTSNAFIWYRICTTDKLPALFDLWQNHCQSSPNSRVFGTSLNIGSVRRRRFVIFGTALFYTISNILFCGFARFGPIEALRNDTTFLVEPLFSEPFIIWELIAQTCTLFASVAFFIPPAFLILYCSLVTKQFSQFTEKFNHCISHESKFNGCLMSLRRQHQYLSKVVFALDDAFNFYLAVVFGAMILLACFMMYQLAVVRSFNSLLVIFLALFWLSVICMKFGFVGGLLANLNEKVF